MGNGSVSIYLDGNLTTQTAFAPGSTEAAITPQDWIIGQGLVESAFDEIRLAAKTRSPAWAKADYDNQKPAQAFPAYGNVVGPNTITTDLEFTLDADTYFNHDVDATTDPIAYTATGLPGGLILNSSNGVISGIPSRAGIYDATVTALYANGQNPSEIHKFTVRAVSPQITIRNVTSVSSTNTKVEYEIISPGGEDPEVFLVADLSDRGKDLYGWDRRLEEGSKGLGVATATFGDLTPGMSYFLRLLARISASEVWTGVSTFARVNPLPSDLPGTIGIWLDATDLDADGNPDGMAENSLVSTWSDKSSFGRHMPNKDGDPLTKLDGFGNKQVVDFDGNDRLWTQYDFRASNAVDWRADGYTAFGVSRYTGGDNERVITSSGGNWLFGHHGNRVRRFYFDGWIDVGTTTDTNFHLFEARHQGRNQATDPAVNVWMDGGEGTYRYGLKTNSNGRVFCSQMGSFTSRQPSLGRRAANVWGINSNRIHPRLHFAQEYDSHNRQPSTKQRHKRFRHHQWASCRSRNGHRARPLHPLGLFRAKALAGCFRRRWEQPRRRHRGEYGH